MTQVITHKSLDTSLYEADFLLWTEATVAKLKARDFDHIDLENLIEEIESLGRSEKKEVRNRLKTLLEHLIKRIYVDMPQEFNGSCNGSDACRRGMGQVERHDPFLGSSAVERSAVVS